MHDKCLCPVVSLIHKPDGGAMLLELWFYAFSKKKEGLLYQAVNHKMSLFLHHDTGSSFAMVETFVTWGGKTRV